MQTDSLCFTSTRFVVEAGEDEQTNPGVYGKQLAAWLVERLRNEGNPDAVAIPEDWGWCVMCKRTPYSLWIGCSNADAESSAGGTEPIVWRCFVEAEIPLLKRLFGKPDVEPGKQKVRNLLARVLFAETSIRMVVCP